MRATTDKEVQIILKTCLEYNGWQFSGKSAYFYKWRDYHMIGMAFFLGLRRKEIALARVEFIDRNNHTYTVDKEISKNNLSRTIPIPEKFYSSLIKYINDFQLNSWLFPSRNNKGKTPIVPRCIGARFELYRELSGLNMIQSYSKDGKKLNQVTMHRIRHNYGDKFKKNLKMAQALLGHKWLSSTDRYLSIPTEEEKSSEVNDAFGKNITDILKYRLVTGKITAKEYKEILNALEKDTEEIHVKTRKS